MSSLLSSPLRSVSHVEDELGSLSSNAHTTSSESTSLDRREPIVVLENVHLTYLLGTEGVPAVRGVSLSVYRGEFVIIYGTSGGGKTSLLNLISTIDRATKGEIRLCGCQINQSTDEDTLSQIRLEKLGYIQQSFNLLGSQTALQNVEIPMILHGVLSKDERQNRAKHLLSRFGMQERFDHYPNMLSGGEQQRVTIARALANEPELLILDEPTGDLDTANGTLVIDHLVRLNLNDGISMIMVTHDSGLKNYAHHVVYMGDGRVTRIEDIPSSTRAEHIACLQYEADRIRSGQLLSGPTCVTESRSSRAYDHLRGIYSEDSSSETPTISTDS